MNPSGSTQACLVIGGLRLLLRSHSASAAFRLRPYYRPFVTGAGAQPADADFSVCPHDASLRPDPHAETTWEEETWRLDETPERRLQLWLRTEDGRLQAAADLAPNAGSGRLYLQPAPAGRRPPFALTHPCDHILLTTLLAHRHGGMLHAGAARLDGAAWVFCGHSGAGKTTLTRAWHEAGATLINDDRVILRMQGDAAFAGAAPWHGVESRVTPGLHPLRGLCFLRQGAEDILTPLSSTEAAGRLSGATFLPLFLKDGVPRVLTTWSRILATVPAYELTFTATARSLALCRRSA